MDAPAFVADESGTRRARVVDMSLGGASLLMDEWLAPNAEIVLLVGKSTSFADGLPAVHGRVRWVRAAQKGFTRVGVAFQALSREAEARLFTLWLTSPSR